MSFMDRMLDIWEEGRKPDVGQGLLDKQFVREEADLASESDVGEGECLGGDMGGLSERAIDSAAIGFEGLFHRLMNVFRNAVAPRREEIGLDVPGEEQGSI